jgi:hypothetical protein
MKLNLLFLIFSLASVIVSAQDTIFVKTGQKIPAVITEKNEIEIKYKKYGAPEPAAIYSIFISDISSIHYGDGIIADYTLLGQNESQNRPKTALDLAGTMMAIKWSFGVSGGYFNRNESADLLTFWQYYTGNMNEEIGGNPYYFPINLGANFVMGKSARNWLGVQLQLIFTPSDAIYASTPDGLNEIKLGAFYYNILLPYGHTLNHKKTLAVILEPAVDFAFESGYIKINNTVYDINTNFGVGFHIALGLDWVISKRITASGRLGERFMNIPESHVSASSSTGYTTFYVTATSEELLTVQWNGPYASLGLSFALYTKLKGVKIE